MFGLNVATFPKAYKSNVATLKSNIVTLKFHGDLQLTLRRWNQRRNVTEGALTGISQRRDVWAQRRDMTEVDVFGVHSTSRR